MTEVISTMPKTNPELVEQADFDRMVADIKASVDTLGPNHPLHPTVVVHESVLTKKPRINFTASKRAPRANYSSTDTVNYVLGDKDGTWEKLHDWRRRLIIESQRHKTNEERAARILKAIGIDDITWVVQVAVPGKLFKNIAYLED